jgi:osomolarity two-component system phosphorelay intermediate protein YPD1
MKVQASCEKMQHYGNKRDEAAGVDLTEQEALDKIRDLLVVVREEYEEASGWLRRFYDEQQQQDE